MIEIRCGRYKFCKSLTYYMKDPDDLGRDLREKGWSWFRGHWDFICPKCNNRLDGIVRQIKEGKTIEEIND